MVTPSWDSRAAVLIVDCWAEDCFAAAVAGEKSAEWAAAK